MHGTAMVKVARLLATVFTTRRRARGDATAMVGHKDCRATSLLFVIPRSFVESQIHVREEIMSRLMSHGLGHGATPVEASV